MKLRIKRAHKLFAVIGLLVVLIPVVIVFGLHRHKANPTRNHVSYGIALGYVLPQMSQSGRINLLKNTRQSGFSVVRFSLAWDVVQPKNQADFDWTSYDAIMKDVSGSGLKPIIILDRTPSWARSKTCSASVFCPPVNMEAFARFSAAAVKRYQGYDVQAWEIWNEPNIANFWKPMPNVEEYAQLLSISYTAIKQQDPKATVLIGGLAGNAADSSGSYIDPRTFLSQLYADKVKNYFNGIAYHPYTSLRLPNNGSSIHNGWVKMYQTSPSIRSIMVANGDQSKALWLTEFGAPTNGPGPAVTDPGAENLPAGADHDSLQAQAQIARQAINDIKDLSWIKNLDWYTYNDSGTATNSADNFWGLVTNNGHPKPAYYVLRYTIIHGN